MARISRLLAYAR